jgi:hypothetical protein
VRFVTSNLEGHLKHANKVFFILAYNVPNYEMQNIRINLWPYSAGSETAFSYLHASDSTLLA